MYLHRSARIRLVLLLPEELLGAAADAERAVMVKAIAISDSY